jgi:hypothetical protein
MPAFAAVLRPFDACVSPDTEYAEGVEIEKGCRLNELTLYELCCNMRLSQCQFAQEYLLQHDHVKFYKSD